MAARGGHSSISCMVRTSVVRTIRTSVIRTLIFLWSMVLYQNLFHVEDIVSPWRRQTSTSGCGAKGHFRCFFPLGVWRAFRASANARNLSFRKFGEKCGHYVVACRSAPVNDTPRRPLQISTRSSHWSYRIIAVVVITLTIPSLHTS